MVGLRPLKVYIALNKARFHGYFREPITEIYGFGFKAGFLRPVFIYYWYKAKVCNLDSDLGIWVSVGKAGSRLILKGKACIH